jgi:MarR family transcriptional regulator, organic hydroperoxide resistance regulator
MARSAFSRKAVAAASVASAPRGDPGELARSVGFELRRADRAVEADLQARLSSVGLQIGMWLYLRALWREDGLTQTELSWRIGARKPTTLDQLRRMQKRGLIRFGRSTEDKRRVSVFLTEEGRTLKARLLPLAKLNHDAALQGFSAEEVETLYDLLHRIRSNVGKMSQAS